MTQQYAYSRSPDHPYAVEMLPLPQEELDGLLMDAKAAYDQLFPAVQTAVRFGSDGEVFNVAHRTVDYKSMAMWTTSVLFGTLEEVAALYLDQNGRVPMVLDSARSRRLYQLATPSSEKPLHGAAMRWSLWKPPSKLSDGRDVCFLEFMDSFVDRETGRRVWARGMRSINHLCCPASQHPESGPDGPVRTYMRVSGMILRETDRPNVLEHVTFVHIDGRGLPNWVVQQAIAANKKASDNLNQVLKIMRQLRPQQVSASLNDGDGDRDCKACGDRVSKWTIAKRCRFCDAILCKRCVEICYHRADVSGKNHRMCLSCAIYTGSVNPTSRSLSGLDYGRTRTRVRNATVAGERTRPLSDTKLNAFTKQNSMPVFALHSSVCSEEERPSISLTDSVDSGSRDDPATARERLENLHLYSPTSSSVNSSSDGSTHSNGMQQRPRTARVTRALTLDLDFEPRRAEPIDLSYLSELVTPRAGATRRVDI
ncbi:hypothetical protein PR003_g24335 [Phytophthora rubi]|uniref:FYVE-type domain-containing protein n=1 Tax=Phytophthora rubi TaxID=129364 RepID=A0A6A4CPI5_9STRA|nr:hypothetical protein PR001_g29672 [Phytophthora rubi]KAE9294135.1 hypothetical protein PR003_g24335 [Phytophthora rubi]